MDLLVCIVEANAAANALAGVASQSLHAVEDCSCVVECCTKVLPAALSVLEGAASTSEEIVAQAVECVQGCKTAMIQLQAALQSLDGHDSEGVMGVLLEHPAVWLDTYRGFRGLTAQLISMACFVRAAAQRGQADDGDEALQDSIKAFMATCSRAREAAHLMGRELPEFARLAASEGWSAGRLRLALGCGGGAAMAAPAVTVALRSGASSPCRRCGCGQGACECSGDLVAAESPAVVLAAASVALHQQPGSQQQQQQQRMGLLRRISKAAAACNNPHRRSLGGGSAASSDLSFTTRASGAAGRMDDAACALVTRIQDLILYDSELDHLEQDRAYLLQRVAHLQEFCDGAAGDAAAVAAEPAAASLIQSEVLLAAVESRLKALESLSSIDSSSRSEACKERLRKGDAPALVACAAGGAMTSRRSPERADRFVDSEDLYDDVRKRRPGLRWLPVCFVGA